MKKLTLSRFSFPRNILFAYCLIALLLAGYIYLHISYSTQGEGAKTSIPVRNDIYAFLAIACLATFVIGRVKSKRQYSSLLVASLVVTYFIVSSTFLDQLGYSWNKDPIWINPYAGMLPGKLFRSEYFTLRGIGLSLLTLANLFREMAWWWFVVPGLDSATYDPPPWYYRLFLVITFPMAVLAVSWAMATWTTFIQERWRRVSIVGLYRNLLGVINKYLILNRWRHISLIGLYRNLFEVLKKYLTIKNIAVYIFILVLLFGYIYLHILYSTQGPGATTSISVQYDVYAFLFIAYLATLVIGRVEPKHKYISLLIAFLFIVFFTVSGTSLVQLGHSWNKGNTWINPYAGMLSDGLFKPGNFTLQGVSLSLLTLANLFREMVWWWFVIPSVDSVTYGPPPWHYRLFLMITFPVTVLAVSWAMATWATFVQNRWPHSRTVSLYRNILDASKKYLTLKNIAIYLFTLTLLLGYIYLHIPYSTTGPRATTSISYQYDVYAFLLITYLVALMIGKVKSKDQKRSLLIASFLICYFIVSSVLLVHKAQLPPSWSSTHTWLYPYAGMLLDSLFRPENFTVQGIGLSILTLADLFREMAWWWFVIPVVDSATYSPSPWHHRLLLVLTFPMTVLTVSWAMATWTTFVQDRFFAFPRLLFNHWFQNIAKKIPNLRGRWRIRLRVVLSVLVFLGIYMVVLARSDNARVSKAIVERKISSPPISLINDSFQISSAEMTDTYVGTLAEDPDLETIYAGVFGLGVFRTNDGGMSWSSINDGLTNYYIEVLGFDSHSSVLYAGTWGGGVFYLDENDNTWHEANAGLAGLNIWTLAIDKNTIYVGVSENGIFRSRNGGQSWQEINNGFESSISVYDIVINQNNGIIYALSGFELYRSQDEGENWQKTNFPTDIYLYGLIVEPDTGALYVGTDSGVYKSLNDGLDWQQVSVGLDNKRVGRLAVVQDTGALLAFTWNRDIYISLNGGKNWEIFNFPLEPKSNVYTIISENSSGLLYLGTYNGVYKSKVDGLGWESVGQNLIDPRIRARLYNPDTNTFYVSVANKIFSTADNGITWNVMDPEFSDQIIHGFALDSKTGALYANVGYSIFRTADNGMTWQDLDIGVEDNFDILLIDAERNLLFANSDSDVYIFHESQGNWIENYFYFSFPVTSLALDIHSGTLYVVHADGVSYSRDGGENWRDTSMSAEQFDEFVRIFDDVQYVSSSNLSEVAYASHLNIWEIKDGTIFIAQRLASENSYWRYFRKMVWWAGWWVEANPIWFSVGILIIFIFVLGNYLISNYTNVIRPYKLPFWMLFLRPRQLETYVRSDDLASRWQEWEVAIRKELLRFGDVFPNDLVPIPTPFRNYALRKYVNLHENLEFLDVKREHIKLLVGNRLLQWHTAWRVSRKNMGSHAGLAAKGRLAVDELAKALAEALGLTILGKGRDFGMVRAFMVEAPALRLNIPLRFPLIFIAEPQPNSATVQTLVDAVDVLKEGGYFSLVVPLEPSSRRLDIPAELRRAIDRSPHVQDFIVLSQDDILNLLIVREPGPQLAQMILRQRDLTLVSPFVINGPVPETMFFGRDAQVKKLVESAGMADFAIVGNRKIGKTSLLQRSRAKMEAGGRVLPLMLDCQTVRDAYGFYLAFEAQTKIKLHSTTPEGFSSTITEIQKINRCPIVLFIDEVDALLLNEDEQGNRLTATWRQLAMASVCRFVFCGSTGLARCLDNPHSPFFNFPQTMALGYLPPETSRLVLTQPLATLGMILEDEEKLIEGVLALTSGHPNLIQYVGHLLIQATNERKDRQIWQSDIENVRHSNEFTDPFLKTIWGEAGPLEKLITLLAPENGFSVTDIEQRLAQIDVSPGPEDLDSALKMLGYYAILEKREKSYNFLPRAFQDILHRTQEVERLIAQEKYKFTRTNNPI